MIEYQGNLIYGDVSKWGRLRALPVADEASNKEWQRSKLCEANASKQFWAPQQDITGEPRFTLTNIDKNSLMSLYIYGDVSKWS